MTEAIRRHSDAPTPYHIPGYAEIEAEIVALQNNYLEIFKPLLQSIEGYPIDGLRAAKERGLNTVLIGPDECATAVADNFDWIIPIADFDFMDGPKILELVSDHVESIDPRSIAINPGIAFLSERGDFSKQVEEAGYFYLGGCGDAVNAVGDKAEAKRLAELAFDSLTDEKKALFDDQSTPVIQSYSTDDLSRDEWLPLVRTTIEKFGPILMKNTLGGGGVGIELITPDMSDTDIEKIFKQQEVVGAQLFDNATSFLFEQFIGPDLKPRHIEVQILKINV